MKRSKRIYILLGILAVVCIAAFAVVRHEEYKEKIKNSDEIILKIPTDSVKSLAWEYDSNSFSFHKDDKWIYDEDEAFPVDEDKINDMLKQFEEFGVSFIIEEVEDYGQYGLDDPECTIKLSTEDKPYEIKLGNFSTMDSERYVSIGDGNVYLVKKDPLESFDVSLKDLIKNDDTPSFTDVSEIKFEGTESYEIKYEKDSPNTYCDDDVYFTEKDGKTLPLDSSRVNSYLKTISNLDLTDFVTYKASDEDLKVYGLDNPELSVIVNYVPDNDDDNEVKTTETFVLNISRDPKEIEEARKKAEENKDKETDENENTEEEKITAYARVGDSRIIYKITSDEYKNLMAASYNDLRHPEVLSADFSDITQFDVTLDGNVYTITTKKKDDKITYYYKDEEIKIDDIKNAFEYLKAESFTDEQPEKKLEMSLTVHLDNENFPEVKIDLYQYDGTYCLAMIDNEPVSLVKRSKAVDLKEAFYAIVLN